MNIDSIKNKDLDDIDMESLAENIKNKEHKKYFLDHSGREHYRLLSYISLYSKENISLLDIGTYKGCSALAFSSNIKNTIHSFNLADQLDLNYLPDNINFYIDNILKNEYKNLIIQSKYILLDTIHDGLFEQKFYKYLIDIKYEGFLLLDDIYLNNEMVYFWNNIKQKKRDITNIGHSTGTGIVYF